MESGTSPLPVNDPMPALSPTATRILEAAKRVLARDGFSKLTFEAIAAESGENAALIRYHFGSKAGLVDALVDSVVHQGSADLLRALSGAAPGKARRRALFETQRAWVTEPDEYRTFYAIVSHVLADERLRPKYKALFAWYGELEAWALASADGDEPPADLKPLGALVVATIDGLGLQVQADEAFDAGPVVEMLWQMVERHLGTRAAPAAAAGGGS